MSLVLFLDRADLPTPGRLEIWIQVQARQGPSDLLTSIETPQSPQDLQCAVHHLETIPISSRLPPHSANPQKPQQDDHYALSCIGPFWPSQCLDLLPMPRHKRRAPEAGARRYGDRDKGQRMLRFQVGTQNLKSTPSPFPLSYCPSIGSTLPFQPCLTCPIRALFHHGKAQTHLLVVRLPRLRLNIPRKW
jgi:hypothetical protein